MYENIKDCLNQTKEYLDLKEGSNTPLIMAVRNRRMDVMLIFKIKMDNIILMAYSAQYDGTIEQWNN